MWAWLSWMWLCALCRVIGALNALEVAVRSDSSSDSPSFTPLGDVVGAALWGLDRHACALRLAAAELHDPMAFASVAPSSAAILKLALVPALGLLILLVFLLEDYLFAAAYPPAPLPPAARTGLAAWIRRCWSRGPKLTTAYAAQQSAAALSTQQPPQHAQPQLLHPQQIGVSTSCCANPNCISHQQSRLPGLLQADSAVASSLFPNEAAMSSHLNFNGFNHIAGPLRYYHTFGRPEPQMHVANGHSTPAKTRKASEAASADAARSPPSSPRSPVAVASPPPAEYVPITLFNARTGFRRTFSMWRSTTFSEMLQFYLAEHWEAERAKYDCMDSAASSDDEATALFAGSPGTELEFAL